MEKLNQELAKAALAANAAIQDIHIERNNLSEPIGRAKGCIAAYRQSIENVEYEAKSYELEPKGKVLAKIADEQRKELSRLNGMMRRTMLTIQVETEKRDKQTLLGSDKSGVRKRVSDKESAVKANATITDSLVKTSQLMAENLHRGTDSIEALSNSSKEITSTNEELKSMQGHIKNSHSLLTKYARKETTDKMFIFLAMVFFMATVIYILKKRLLNSYLDYPSSPQHPDDTVLL